MLKKLLSNVSFIVLKKNIQIVKKIDFQIFMHVIFWGFKDTVEKSSEIWTYCKFLKIIYKTAFQVG
jgi:hypothetical protein